MSSSPKKTSVAKQGRVRRRPDAAKPGRRAKRSVSARPRTLTDQDIYREIHDAIVEQRLPPGAKLGQDELGAIFGVSKTRVRPILHMLAQQKIVVIERMRGAFVARPSVEEAREVNAARQIVEEGVVRAATRMATADHIAALRRNIAEERKARQRNELGLAHRLTGRFHRELAAITGNQVVVDLVRELISRDSLVVALYQKPTAVGCSIVGHAELVDAIASGDEERAAASMRQHLQEVIDSLDLNGERNAWNGLRSVFRRRGARP